MNYEKKYKEALERAKKFMSVRGVSPDEDAFECAKILSETIFPELKESDDERIRKELISFFTERAKYTEDSTFNGLSSKEIIAWLEKQGEQNLANSAKTCKDEQKPNPCDGCINRKGCINCENGELREVEQKPADKAEPKFKVGDWVIDVQGVSSNQIIGYEDDSYYIETSCSKFYLPMKLAEKNYRLWTIQDAKDGDVLSWDDSKCIALFKNIYDENSFNSYGFVGHCTDTFESRQSYHDIEGAHPATKEQRDLLFKKMHEAGYEWNADKKELKKIEKNPDNKVEPKFKVKYAGSEYNVLEVKDIAGVTYYGIEDEPNHIDYVQAENCERVDGYSIKESGSPFPTKPAKFSEQNSTWSEEDEVALGDALWCCKQAASIAKDENDMGNVRYAEHWLNSLKDRCTWKPSDEQMKALKEAVDEHFDIDGCALWHLYEDLKKLREE